MDDDWKPDEKIAETYVRHGELEFQVYTFERNSSAALGPRRFQETHVYQWDRKERKRGEWLHQLYGHGIEFHSRVVESLAGTGTFDGTERDCTPYEKTLAILEEATRKAIAKIGPHTHVAGEGADIDTCGRCGLDIRDEIHLRVNDPRKAVTT